MRLIERFQMALGSHLGMVFVGLVVGLLLLAIIYWFLVVRQKRRDLLAYLYRSYFEKVQALAKDFTFTGSHKAEFFGRQTIVTFAKGTFGVCLVPPPSCIDPGVRERFGLFHRAKEHLKMPGLAPVLWKTDQTVLALIEGRLLDPSGRFLPSLRQHLFDKKLAATSREQILLEIARALSHLHEQHTDQGSRLYHGFLLPRYIFVDMDASQRINGIVIGSAGMSFALGPERLLEQLNGLRDGKLPIEKYCAQDLLEQIAILAPEQKSSLRLHEVGPACDFFAFGAIAASLLSQQRFVSNAHVDWQRIPQRWTPFLKACLSDDITKRPQDFLELEDWLNDPEMALTHVQAEEGSKESAPLQADDKAKYASSLLTTIVRPAKADKASTDQQLADGIKAIKTGKWQIAKKSLQKVLAEDPNHAVAHAHMAIACYELDEKKKAEGHYDKAKQADPMAAKSFRQHLAFRL